jgi:hypothetical protein
MTMIDDTPNSRRKLNEGLDAGQRSSCDQAPALAIAEQAEASVRVSNDHQELSVDRLFVAARRLLRTVLPGRDS